MPTVDEEDKRKFRHLTDAENAELIELYELGKMGILELSEKFSCSRQTVFNRIKAAGAKKGSRANEIRAEVNKQIVQNATKEETYASKRLDWIEETRIEGVKVLGQIQVLARKTVADAVRDKKPMESVEPDLKSIQRFNKIIIDNIDAKLRVLKAEEVIDESDLPSLNIEDLTDDDILQHHKNTGVLPEDATLDDLLKDAEIDLEAPS